MQSLYSDPSPSPPNPNHNPLSPSLPLTTTAAAMDDEFHEYNPHPYQGGYDIALTYGSPLPPTPAICYPLSSPPAPPPHPAIEPPPPSPPAVPAIEYAPPPSPPASNAIPEPYSSDGNWACWRAAAAAEEVTSWRDSDGHVAREWRRAANYLFGYSEGYGERWAGTDTYGIPIYANKTYGDGPPVVEAEPSREERLEWYQSQDRELNVVPCVNSGRWEVVDYTVQEKPVEGNWGYSEVYGERLDPWQNSCSSYEERLDTTDYYGVPEYGYNRHYGEEALTVQIQTHEVAMSVKPGYSEEYTSEANWHSSSNGEPLEAFVPSWEQNPNYYGVYEQDAYPKPQSHFLSNSEQDYDSHHAFGSHSYTYGTHNHEQALSVQLEPFKPSWSQNPLYYGTYSDDVSPKSHQDDDPYHETSVQFFCPFQKYSVYE